MPPGTDELKMVNPDSQLAVLVDRSKTTERAFEKLSEQLDRQNGNFSILQQKLTEINEQHLARSEANKQAIEAANKLIDHVRLRTIDQDAQQVLMIHNEETARNNQDDRLRTEMAAMNQKHTDEMAALGKVIEKLADNVSDLKGNMRVVTVISSFLSLIASAVIAGSLLHLIP